MRNPIRTFEIARLAGIGSLTEHLGQLLVHQHHLVVVPDLPVALVVAVSLLDVIVNAHARHLKRFSHSTAEFGVDLETRVVFLFFLEFLLVFL